jgi:hypothetical protein
MLILWSLIGAYLLAGTTILIAETCKVKHSLPMWLFTVFLCYSIGPLFMAFLFILRIPRMLGWLAGKMASEYNCGYKSAASD